MLYAIGIGIIPISYIYAQHFLKFLHFYRKTVVYFGCPCIYNLHTLM